MGDPNRSRLVRVPFFSATTIMNLIFLSDPEILVPLVVRDQINRERFFYFENERKNHHKSCGVGSFVDVGGHKNGNYPNKCAIWRKKKSGEIKWRVLWNWQRKISNLFRIKCKFGSADHRNESPQRDAMPCLWLSVGNCAVFYLIGLLRLISPDSVLGPILLLRVKPIGTTSRIFLRH